MSDTLPCEKEQLDGNEESLLRADEGMEKTRLLARLSGGIKMLELLCPMIQSDYQKVFDKFPEDPRILFRMGWIAWRWGFISPQMMKEKMPEADDYLQRAIQNSHPTDPNLAIMKGMRGFVLNHDAKRWDEAIDCYKSAILDLEENLKENRVMSKRLMQLALGTTDVDNLHLKTFIEDKLIKTLESAGRREDAKEVYLARLQVIVYPEDPSAAFAQNYEKWRRFKKMMEGGLRREHVGWLLVLKCWRTWADFRKLNSSIEQHWPLIQDTSPDMHQLA